MSSTQLSVTNPKIDGSQTSVAALLNGLPRQSNGSISVTGSIEIPSTEWSWYNHLQGIGMYNGSLTPSGFVSASADKAFLMGIGGALGSNSAVVQSVHVPNDAYYHAGGLQILGNFLPVPLEGEGQSGIVNGYDAINPGSTNSPHWDFTITLPGAKSSAVAVTNYTDINGMDWALMCVYLYDGYGMLWLQTPPDQVYLPNQDGSQWKQVGSNALPQPAGGGQYQAFALVTTSYPSSPDVVQLVAFNQNEVIDLYTVSTYPGTGYAVTLLESFTGWGGSDWRWAAGLQIVSSTQLRIVGSPQDPAGTTTRYSFVLPTWS